MPLFEILDNPQTALGLLCLRRRELLCSPGTVITEVTIDNLMLMSSYHTESERALADLALARHSGEALRVLVGGLGLGYTALQARDHPRVAHVRVIEFLPEVIGRLRDGLVPLSEALQELDVVQDDVYALLLGPATETWDLILIDVDHSPEAPLDPASERFYSPEGLRDVQAHLAPGGVLAVWSTADDQPFADAMKAAFSETAVEQVVWWNDLIDEEKTDTLFLGIR